MTDLREKNPSTLIWLSAISQEQATPDGKQDGDGMRIFWRRLLIDTQR
jgi:hypothetical protein